MKRANYLLIIAATFTAALCSSGAFAFDDPDAPPPIDSQIRASLAACNAFAASFQSQSENDDQNAFQAKFGVPRNANYSTTVNEGSSIEYNYDSFTKITLDCASDSCRARCSPKY